MSISSDPAPDDRLGWRLVNANLPDYIEPWVGQLFADAWRAIQTLRADGVTKAATIAAQQEEIERLEAERDALAEQIAAIGTWIDARTDAPRTDDSGQPLTLVQRLNATRAEFVRVREERDQEASARQTWMDAKARETAALMAANRRAEAAERERDDLRLTLAAEQGRPEGAPLGWRNDIGHEWIRDWTPTETRYGTILWASVRGDPVDGYVLMGKIRAGDVPAYADLPEFGTTPDGKDLWLFATARAAMLAADKATP